MLNKETILNQLKAQDYIGKPYDGCGGVKSDVYLKARDIIREQLKADGILKADGSDQSRVGGSYHAAPHTEEILLDGQLLFKLIYKRKKGKSHYNYFGSYCDWTLKDLDGYVIGGSDDITTQARSILAYLNKEKEAKNALEYRARQVYRYIRETFGVNRWEAKEIAERVAGYGIRTEDIDAELDVKAE